MSTAAATPPISHTSRSAHPLPLREQAFTLHCHGLRSPAIAAELGVPERTIRAWIAAALDDLKDDLQINRRQQLLLAVERQNAITAAAWQQFEAETAARSALLDALLDACQHSTDAASASAVPLPRLPATVPAPRYLSLILQANKETHRLLGLYTLAKLELLALDAAAGADSAADTASTAESATGTDSPTPVDGGTTVGAPRVRPDCPEATSPAETATAFTLAADSDFPAETATVPHGDDTAAETATAFPPSVSQAPSAAGIPQTESRRRADSALNPPCSFVPSVPSMPSVVTNSHKTNAGWMSGSSPRMRR